MTQSLNGKRVAILVTDGFEQVASIPVGALPHGLWPSGDSVQSPV